MSQTPKDSLKNLKFVVAAMILSMVGGIIFIGATIVEKSRNTSKQEVLHGFENCNTTELTLPIKGLVRNISYGDKEWSVEVETKDSTHLFFVTPCTTTIRGHVVIEKSKTEN